MSHKFIAASAVWMLLAGCAAAPALEGGAPDSTVDDGAQPAGDAADPLESINRVTYRFNDTLDHWVLRPVAKSYQAVTPRPLRKGVSNFFDNLLTPIDIANSLLQAKFAAALSETGRLLLNSTLGIGGIFDPATDAGLDEHDEDFGQTLAVWGVPAGPYLVLPLLGPSTMRDAPALYADVQLAPLTHYDNSSVRDKLLVLYGINTRERLLATDRAVRNALDPYVFVREAYLQNRTYVIHDGNPPLEDVYGDY